MNEKLINLAKELLDMYQNGKDIPGYKFLELDILIQHYESTRTE